jgi:predicted metal-binding protein
MKKKMELLERRMIPRRIVTPVRPSRIKKDLERYRTMALEMGAADAAIIPSKEILIDERVRAKCMFPRCRSYGTSMNCPPFAPDLDFTRRLVAKYRSAVLFCVKGSREHFAGEDQAKFQKEKDETKFLFNRICSELESRAFYDGYHLSLAFGHGTCKSLWCPDVPCAGLETGKGCRFPLKSRSSMEAVGMDVFTMAARRGWEIYPVAERVDVAKTPHVLLVGLILIV